MMKLEEYIENGEGRVSQVVRMTGVDNDIKIGRFRYNPYVIKSWGGKRNRMYDIILYAIDNFDQDNKILNIFNNDTIAITEENIYTLIKLINPIADTIVEHNCDLYGSKIDKLLYKYMIVFNIMSPMILEYIGTNHDKFYETLHNIIIENDELLYKYLYNTVTNHKISKHIPGGEFDRISDIVDTVLIPTIHKFIFSINSKIFLKVLLNSRYDYVFRYSSKSSLICDKDNGIYIKRYSSSDKYMDGFIMSSNDIKELEEKKDELEIL